MKYLNEMLAQCSDLFVGESSASSASWTDVAMQCKELAEALIKEDELKEKLKFINTRGEYSAFLQQKLENVYSLQVDIAGGDAAIVEALGYNTIPRPR